MAAGWLCRGMLLWCRGGVSRGRGTVQALLLVAVSFQVVIPIKGLVGEGEGMLLSPFWVSSWPGDLSVIGVFTATCETVLIELSGLVRLAAVRLLVGSELAIELGVNECRVRRIGIGCVSGTGTGAFFFRLRPLPPRLPLFVFLSRTLFFFFPVVGVVRVAQPDDDAHRGRTTI